METSRSKDLFSKAKELIPGGVNSPVRAFKEVGIGPLFIQKAEGARLYDVDGNSYVDYVGSWGSMILGHNNPVVVEALKKAIDNGISFGACSEIEVKLAGLITKLVPSVEMVRMVNSGTEAGMSAIRLARGYTKKDKIIKLEGCYHGNADPFLTKVGSNAAALGLPDSPGVTKGNAADTLTAVYGDIESVKGIIKKNKGNIAALIIEPIACNMGCIDPHIEFLSELRELTRYERILLVFDEAMTGFRVARGGAQEIYKIKPDLTCFGKIIGGGLPVGAYGGRKEIMEMIAPSGPVYQAGTLSGNPLAMTAGYETLKLISEDKNFYTNLNKMSEYLYEGIKENLRDLSLNYQLNYCGSMFTLFFTDKPVTDYSSAKTSDTNIFSEYFKSMLKRGVYQPPSQFEANFISAAHTIDDLDKTIKASYLSLKAI